MKSLRYIFFAFVIFLIASLNSFAAEIEPFYERLYDGKSICEYTSSVDIPEVDGYAAYVYNLETGSVMYSKNASDMVYPASTVKLMTAIVAYENIPDLSVSITASKSAVTATQGANMAIKAGESFTAEQLLYGLLVTGANDAANVLAEHVAGGIDEFCVLMNEKAKQLGAVNTHYTNPTGLHSDEMKTTAKDTAIVARYFYYINTLFEISNTTRYIISPTPQTDAQRTLLNRNLLISRVRSEDYYYSAAKGMSLGNTPEAGECIVTTAADESGLTYLCVVMNAYSDDENNMACTDAKNLLEMCLNNFSYTGVLSEKSIICEIPVRLAVNTDYVTLLPGAELKALLPTDLDYASEITVEPRVSDDYASAPVYEGEVYGEAVVKYRNETVLGSVPLVASKNVDKSNVLYFLDRAENLVTGRWFRVFAISAVILFIIYFLISVFVSSGKKRVRRR